MKSMKMLRSQSGFSLIELMVVVAIIGILATMSIGAVQKQIAKSRQSEAKTQLASVYTSEKAFFAEFNIYSGGFNIVGYAPEGNLRYAVGFSAAGPNLATLQASGYTGTVNPANFSTLTACPTTAQTATVKCRSLAEASLGPAIAGVVPTNQLFTSQATSRLSAGNALTNDVWSMDQNKVLTNNTNGVDSI